MRWVICLGALGLLAACAAPAAPGPAAPAAPPAAQPSSAGSAAPAPPAAAPAAAPAPPRLERARIAYGAPSGAFAAPWMAKEAGLFAKYGLDAELTYLSSSPTMIASMLAGEIDFNELAAPAPQSAVLEGGEVVWITSAVNTPVFLVIGRPELTSMADLRGRTIGVTRIGTTTHLFMRLALRAAGLDPERDVDIRQTGGTPETLAALQSGGIAAGVTGPPSHLVAQEAGMRVLADIGDLGIAWPSGGTVATRALIAARPAVVGAYVKAYTEAVYLLRTDRERAIDVIAKYGDLADRRLAEQTWLIYRDRYTLPPYPDLKALQTVVDEELVNTSPRAREVPLDAYYDDHFVRDLDQSGFVQALAR